MNHLELFSGTHSFGKVSSKRGYNVVSLDRDLDGTCPFGSGYKNDFHIMEDIMTWNYKMFPPNYFKIITASPVCLWWSHLRVSNIGRYKKDGTIFTREELESDILKKGIPMVDKVFEIINYYKPKYFIIENPASGRMKDYINELIPYYDVDYCKYSDFGYRKRTRFWTNIENFNNRKCAFDCKNLIIIDGCKIHKKCVGRNNIDGEKPNKLERYRIPQKLIEELFDLIN